MILAMAVILGFKREVTPKMTGFRRRSEVIDGAGINAAESRPVTAAHCTVRGVDRATVYGVRRRPYAVKSGIVRTPDAMEGVALKGVDGSYDWSFFAGRLTEGRLPRVGDSVRTKDSLLLSARTTRLLGVHAGDKVEMLFVAGREAPPRPVQGVGPLFDGDGGVGRHGADRPPQRAAVVGVVAPARFRVTRSPRDLRRRRLADRSWSTHALRRGGSAGEPTAS